MSLTSYAPNDDRLVMLPSHPPAPQPSISPNRLAQYLEHGEASVVERYVRALEEAAQIGRREHLTSLLADPPRVHWARGIKWETLVVQGRSKRSLAHLAAQGGHTGIIEELVLTTNIHDASQAAYDALLNARDCCRRTPAHVAAIAGQRETFNMLRTLGADLSIIDEFGKTPYDYQHAATAVTLPPLPTRTTPRVPTLARGGRNR